MKKLAIVDLSFTWPPDGGARTDVYEVATRLKKHFEVQLFVPEILGWARLGRRWLRWPLDRTRFFWRGQTRDLEGLDITRIPFSAKEFNAKEIGPRFRDALRDWDADEVFITDGWYLKPYLIDALASYEPVVRIYAHEMLCLKGNGFFYRDDQICERNYLDKEREDRIKCVRCTAGFYLTYPSPTWIQEFVFSRAWSRKYPETVRQAMGKARAFIVYNEFTASRIRPFAKNVEVIPSGVDLNRFERASSKRHRGSDDKKIILALGRMEEPRKGFWDLLKACRTLRARRQDFELWTTGNLKPQEEWHKVLGWLSQEEITKTLQRTHLLTVPSRWPEPQGIVAVEGMAAGLPVLATKVGGLQDLISEKNGGFLVEPGDILGMAGHLDTLLSDSQLCETMGDFNIRWVQGRFDWNDIVEKSIRPLFET